MTELADRFKIDSLSGVVTVDTAALDREATVQVTIITAGPPRATAASILP